VSMRLINGETFKALRLDRGLTQVDIARSAGVTKGFINHLEGGVRGCTAETAQKIAAAFGEPKLSVEHLFKNTVHPVRQSATSRPRSASSLPAAS
jgi:transcriptional regulator with XRE-family HTH domain